MNNNDGFVICKLKRADEIMDAFSQLSDYHLVFLENMEQYRCSAKKLAEYGVFFAAYLDNELLGTIAGYANNHETKCAFSHSLVISHEAGLLRGIIWKELLKTFSFYAKEQGMEYCTAEVADDNIYAKKQYMLMGAEVFDRDFEHSRDWIRFKL